MNNFEFGRFTINRVGQQHPSIGDDLVVSVKIFMPTGKGSIRILDDICFGSRVCVFGAPLIGEWGNFVVGGERCKELLLGAETWQAAEEKARNFAVNELKNLNDAIQKRRKILNENK